MTARRCHVERGDCLAVLKGLQAESVDLVLTDCPYSSGGAFRSDRVQRTASKYGITSGAPDFAGDARDQRGFMIWASLWLAECLRVMKPGAIIACFIDWRQLEAMTDAMQIAGIVRRGLGVWAKPGARPQMGRPTQDCEFIPWGTRGARALEGPIGPGMIHARPPRDRVHQTQTPIAVLQPWVELAPFGGLVLDPFCGSGSTGVAALASGRRFLGIEIDATYQAIAEKRLAGVGPVEARPSPLVQGDLL